MRYSLAVAKAVFVAAVSVFLEGSFLFDNKDIQIAFLEHHHCSLSSCVQTSPQQAWLRKKNSFMTDAIINQCDDCC